VPGCTWGISADPYPEEIRAKHIREMTDRSPRAKDWMKTLDTQRGLSLYPYFSLARNIN
jgi:hypothetical protein